MATRIFVDGSVYSPVDPYATALLTVSFAGLVLMRVLIRLPMSPPRWWSSRVPC